MSNTLAAIFFFCFVYGCTTNHLGAAFISLAMVPLMIVGERMMGKRDREFEASPSNAKSPLDTQTILDQQGVEGSADRL